MICKNCGQNVKGKGGICEVCGGNTNGIHKASAVTSDITEKFRFSTFLYGALAIGGVRIILSLISWLLISEGNPDYLLIIILTTILSGLIIGLIESLIPYLIYRAICAVRKSGERIKAFWVTCAVYFIIQTIATFLS